MLIQSTETPQKLDAAVRAAVAALRDGRTVALPTETVYGLAANAFDPRAVEQIFAIKGRPAFNPIIVHVASVEMARQCVANWPPIADKLAEAFWPGPLTLVLPKSKSIPDVVTAGGKTVGIRWPRHPIFQSVINLLGLPLAAPSANLSGQTSPTTAQHVLQSLGDRVELVVDGGPSEVGIESTVLDLSVRPAEVLRPGMIHVESLSAFLTLRSDPAKADILRSPGLLQKHYSPKAKLFIWHPPKTEELNQQLERTQVETARVHLLTHQQRPENLRFGQICVLPHDPVAYAKALYAELHRSDESGAELIIVEAVPNTPEWSGVSDRLQRAAA